MAATHADAEASRSVAEPRARERPSGAARPPTEPAGLRWRLSGVGLRNALAGSGQV